MSRPSVVIELAAAAETVGRDLAAGGVFVPGCALAIYDDCELIVRGAGGEVVIAARVVFVDDHGAGLELVGFTAELRAQVGALVTATLGSSAMISRPPPSRAATPAPVAPIDIDRDQADDDAPDTSTSRIALNVHERLRGLTIPQQLKLAHTGELAERVVLERLYGKAVWDALLRNPRVSPPEVARIARMGTLPRPTIEQIVGNGAWLAVPEIRRALLSNPRLGTDQILRVLRPMPKAELKLATIQTAYPLSVRDAARKLLKDS